MYDNVLKPDCTQQPEWPIFVSPGVWPWLFYLFDDLFTNVKYQKQDNCHFHSLILENFIKNNFHYRRHHCSVYLRTFNSLWHLLSNITKAYLWDLLLKVRLLDSSGWTNLFPLSQLSLLLVECNGMNLNTLTTDWWSNKYKCEIFFSLNSDIRTPTGESNKLNSHALLHSLCFENRNFPLLVW